jgi:hypothetical protein
MQPAHGVRPGPPVVAPGQLLGVAGQLQIPLPTEQQQQEGQTKQRKPYTLQKAREKWTDEEHNKFVEGLRLHGRQWRKIEGGSNGTA